jgi:hypothetical protein
MTNKTRTVSIGTMIEQLDGLRDTRSISDWENQFITSILERYLLAKKDTRSFTGRQVEVIERIWSKHFA